MNQNDYIMKLYALEQQANQFGEQLQAINQQIAELELLKKNLAHFEKSKDKEIFAEFGKGIFIKAQVDKKEFLVDVGNKVLVKKTGKEIVKIIEDQIVKFESIKPEISKRVEQINKELNNVVEQAKNEKENVESKKSEVGEKKAVKEAKKTDEKVKK